MVASNRDWAQLTSQAIRMLLEVCRKSCRTKGRIKSRLGTDRCLASLGDLASRTCSTVLPGSCCQRGVSHFSTSVTALKMYSPTTDILTSYMKITSLALGSWERGEKVSSEGTSLGCPSLCSRVQAAWICHPSQTAHSGNKVWSPKWAWVLLK